MATDQTVKVILKGEDNTKAAFSSAGKSADGLNKGLSTLSKTLLGATAAVGGMAVAFGVSAVKSAMEAESATAQLNAVLKSTGNAAGFTAKEILDYSASLQKMTTFNDEAITGAQNLLLTFTNIKGPIFKEATATILDMSQALGQDLKSSAIQLGKALNDPIQGITALSRVGVSFTDKQKDLIQSLVDSGKTMEAQKIILKELNVEFGGSAAAAAGTFAGKIEQLKNAFDDFKETIGVTIITALTPLITMLLDFGGTVDMLKEKILGWLSLLDEQTGIVTHLKDVWAALTFEFTENLLPVFEEFWSKHGPLMVELGKSLAIVFGVTLLIAFKLLVDIIAGLAIVMSRVLAIGTALLDVAFSTWTVAIDAFSAAWNGAKRAIEAVANAIQRVIDLAKSAGSKVSGVLGIDGARASGGPVSAGGTYLVGENGPELFRPSSSGSIIPNRALGGAGVGGITINISGNTLLDSTAGEKIGEQIMRVLKNNLRI